MIGRTIADLGVDDLAEITRRVGPDDVAAFVHAVGDHNPVHSDAAYAASTSFKVPIAPGIYTAGLVSAVIGTVLPGPGAIYLSQSLTFLKPVLIGDTITARAQVVELLRERNRVRLRTVCVNQRGDEVLVGAYTAHKRLVFGARHVVGVGSVIIAVGILRLVERNEFAGAEYFRRTSRCSSLPSIHTTFSGRQSAAISSTQLFNTLFVVR